MTNYEDTSKSDLNRKIKNNRIFLKRSPKIPRSRLLL